MGRRTIGRHWPGNAPRGDYQVNCDYCGGRWRRSQCRRDASGLLACPWDMDGRDKTTLDRLNAEAMRRGRPKPHHDGGSFHPHDPDAEGTHVLDVEDPALVAIEDAAGDDEIVIIDDEAVEL